MKAPVPIRKPTRQIKVGSVLVGGDAPISVQSMTNTETCDVAATVAQIERCALAGGQELLPFGETIAIDEVDGNSVLAPVGLD